MQYIYAYEIMKKYNYEKVIILGSDTIVCGRLDEFLDNDSTPVLATLNYWIQESTEHWLTPTIEVELENGKKEIDHLNINADVVCFNNSEALLKVITLSTEHYCHFSIQGGMNELAWIDKSALNLIDLFSDVDFETELYKKVISLNKAVYYEIEGLWIPIDTPKDLTLVNLNDKLL